MLFIICFNLIINLRLLLITFLSWLKKIKWSKSQLRTGSVMWTTTVVQRMFFVLSFWLSHIKVHSSCGSLVTCRHLFIPSNVCIFKYLCADIDDVADCYACELCAKYFLNNNKYTDSSINISIAIYIYIMLI